MQYYVTLWRHTMRLNTHNSVHMNAMLFQTSNPNILSPYFPPFVRSAIIELQIMARVLQIFWSISVAICDNFTQFHIYIYMYIRMRSMMWSLILLEVGSCRFLITVVLFMCLVWLHWDKQKQYFRRLWNQIVKCFDYVMLDLTFYFQHKWVHFFRWQFVSYLTTNRSIS